MSSSPSGAYIMEDPREGSRLEQKIDPDAWVERYLEPHLFQDAQVLDVGCGPGTILRAAASTGRRARGVGIDVGPVRIRLAQDKNADKRSVEFVRGDVQELQFGSGTFDVVYSRMLL